MPRLQDLHQAMRRSGLDRCRFPYVRNGVQFDVFFFADKDPFGLMFGLVGSRWAFSVDVLPGYRVETRLDRETYDGLVRALRLKFDPERPFSPAAFFRDLNENIPHDVRREDAPRPEDVARYRRDVDEADKVYFVRWRAHSVEGNTGHVTRRNLEKTRILLGEAVYEVCRENDISSVWSDVEHDRSDRWRDELRPMYG